VQCVVCRSVLSQVPLSLSLSLCIWVNITAGPDADMCTCAGHSGLCVLVCVCVCVCVTRWCASVCVCVAQVLQGLLDRYPASLSVQRARSERSLRSRVNEFILSERGKQRRRQFEAEFARRGELLLQSMLYAVPT